MAVHPDDPIGIATDVKPVCSVRRPQNEDVSSPADLSDADLLDAFQRSSRQAGDPEADLILAEIEWRGLDV